MTENLNNYSAILEAQKHLNKLQMEHWLQYELVTYQWWVILVMLLIPWIIWRKLVDKPRTGIILAYGLYVILAVTAMDMVGIALQLWFYPIALIPIVPFTATLDWSMLPIIHMLIYQYFSRWKTFLAAEAISSVILAFLGEPLCEWVGIYFVLHWYHYWSFPIYIVKAIIGKWLIESVVYRHQRERA
jgi:hypothetical protein